MAKYCKTIMDIEGQRWYGIDLMLEVDNLPLMSGGPVTRVGRACCLVRWLN